MMGLKFERTNELDKLFDSFAVDPKKQEMPLEELKKQQTNAKKEKEAGQQQAKKTGITSYLLKIVVPQLIELLKN